MADVVMDIKITKGSGPDPLEYIKTIELAFGDEAIVRDLQGLKNRVLQHLETFIKENKKRDSEKHPEKWRLTATNNLYNTIEAGSDVIRERTNRFRLTIGNYAFLKKHAPYWKVINYGGYIPPAAWGYFGEGKPPMGTVNTEAFHRTGKTGKQPKGYTRTRQVWLMRPMQPIAPMYYLNEMAKAFTIEMLLLNDDYKKRIANAAKAPARRYTKEEIIKLQLAGYDIQ